MQNYTPLSSSDVTEFRSRIAAVFAGLAANNIDARQRFKCCGSCALAEMPSDVPWAYFHEQDHEGTLAGDLYIGFGAPSDESALGVARVTVALARAQGLSVVWDGTIAQRVLICWTGAPISAAVYPGQAADAWTDEIEMCECGMAESECECDLCELCGWEPGTCECNNCDACEMPEEDCECWEIDDEESA